MKPAPNQSGDPTLFPAAIMAALTRQEEALKSGDPESAREDLQKIMQIIQSGKIPDNSGEDSGNGEEEDEEGEVENEKDLSVSMGSLMGGMGMVEGSDPDAPLEEYSDVPMEGPGKMTKRM